MRFQLHCNSPCESNVAYINIIDDNGKHIGNTMIHCYTYINKCDFAEQMRHEHKCTRLACMEAAKRISVPGNIAYVGIIELDYRERGRGYGPKVLQMVPIICAQFHLPHPDVICAYIAPNQYRLNLETYQHQGIDALEHHKMYKIMHKTFRRAGFRRTNIVHPQVVVKRLVKA
ncbi:MAG: hypothetical protein IJZ68_08460 [Bacteroidaceae bacterium]|nr:hypothetical protein [Bacteroidaceae bacterium]